MLRLARYRLGLTLLAMALVGGGLYSRMKLQGVEAERQSDAHAAAAKISELEREVAAAKAGLDALEKGAPAPLAQPPPKPPSLRESSSSTCSSRSRSRNTRR
eukprot:COSAG04_NODE_1549_length_6380_cov_5.164305_1_plen_101_part_10